MLRNAGSGFAISPNALRAQRPLHIWSHLPAAVDASFVAKLPASSRTSGRKLIFDASCTATSEDAIGGQVAKSSTADAREDLMAALLAGMSESARIDSANWLSDQGASSQAALPSTSRTSTLQGEDGTALFTSTSSSSPTPPRTPSPSGSQSFKSLDKGVRFGDVKEPPVKLAATTSAEPSLSSSPSGESNASQVHSSVASTSTASTSSLSSSQPPPPPSQPQPAINGHWAKAFNVPRSNKRNDFMLEHGAYGIPKRHPLSSIRSSKGKGKEVDGTAGERQSGGNQDAVTTSRVQAAAGMLSAAADFLAGPQTGTSKEHRPMKGEEALNMAFSGGSTADGQEVRKFTSYRKGQQPLPQTQEEKQQQQSGPSKMVIRGEDGRIIKDRLRSVQVGEDAYFLRPDSLGVADGVGGWTSRPGADPALFSRLLMHFCAVELSRYDNLSAADLAADNGSLLSSWAAVDPVEVMHRAWERCVRASRREGILGSSTALLALLRGDELRIANMGDCVLMIIRGGEMLFRSTEQQHSFNFPVQLGMMGDTAETVKKRTEAANKSRAAGEGEVKSEHLEDYDDVEDVPAGKAKISFDDAIDGNEKSSINEDEGPEWDEPRRDAGRWSVRVQADDIIVVGSDGLMDNLFDEDIIEEIVRFLPYSTNGGQQQETRTVDASTFSPQLVSEALCSRAKAVSEDSRAISSPFQQRAMEEGLHYVGGKHDDISVLVCLVGEREGIDASAATSDGTQTTANTTTDKCLIH
jgi:serine/threonine protein phosphatase PrpC